MSTFPDNNAPSAPSIKDETVAIEVDKGESEKPNYNTMSNAESITASDIIKLRNIQEKYEQAKYLRKAYTVVLLQLLNVGSFVLLFLCNDEVNEWTKKHKYITLIFGLAAIVTYSIHSCVRHHEYAFLNFVSFVLYTISEGLFIGSLTTVFDVDVLLFATGITILLSLSLTLYAFRVEGPDFSTHSKLLLASFLGIIIFGCAAMILHNYIFLLVVSIVADIYLSIKFIQNTVIVKNSENFDISASVIIFISIMNLFVFICISLQIVSSTDITMML